MKQIRYKNRKNVDEVIKPILSLNLLSMFDGLQFPILPNVFENALEY